MILVLKSVMVDGEEKTQTSFNSIYMMIDSGARGSKTQIRQLGRDAWFDVQAKW